ncbi:unnamed protein product [Mytilus coruscus]|uniref:Novel STAND NTPase 3 domain-containing protein n=1 Tax=Mytilus coruscus TaxID=42192 RepID=A0A6J8CRG2_MYTCO|nr:unnamed protein product [Mytilus coruscus]
MMEDIILRKVEEGIAQYTERLHNDIYYQQINDWKIDDNKFIVTKTTNEIYDRLQRDSCVLVVGRAGCHKSSIVRHIALKMQSEEQYDIIPIFTAGSIFELINQRRNQIFVVDDFCGKVIINSQSVDVWYSHMDDILKLIHNVGKSKGRYVAELKFLFATRLDVYDEMCFQNLTGFTKYVYQLSDRPLTDDEKLPIIKNYFP